MEKEKNKERIPQLRFPEFKNAPAWEQRKSDKIFQSVSDKNHPDLPVLSASQELGMVKRDDVGIDIKYDKSSLKNYKRVVPGQFVIHLRSFQGGFAHSIIEGITSPAYTILDFVKLDEHSDLFWKNILTSRDFIKRLEAVTYGIRDGRSISFSDFSSLNFNFPTLPEQKAIGDFFSTLDHSIALHQRELENLKNRKKSLLQKMFPKNGESVPKIRFPEFKNAPAWEQRKLGEVAERVRGNDGRMDLPTLTISAEKGWLDQRERFSANIAGKEQKNYTLLKQGELSYNHGNSKLAKYGVVFELQSYSEALVPKVYHSFRMINDNSATFIEYMFATKIPDRELGKLISSGARMDGLLNINYDEFMGIRILIPTLASEQKAIGDFFSTLDRSIALHQRKLEHLKLRKKAILQKMFP